MSIFRIFKMQGELRRGLMVEMGQHILTHTCQVFYVTGKTFKPTGTGVLFQHDGRYFLISAGHVLQYLAKKALATGQEQIDVKMAIPNGDDLVFLSGRLEFTKWEAVDIAIMELEPEVIEDLNGYYQFLTLGNLAIDHKQVETMQYITAGYPIISTTGKIVEGVPHIKSRPFVLTTRFIQQPPCGELYPWQAAFDYDRGTVVETKTSTPLIGPEAKGVSGSGIWYVEFTEAGGIHPTYKLIAIATDHIDTYSNIIIGTKIDIITESLRQKFGLTIPKSTIITVNILS
jgi:hypothetical protein